MPYGILGHTADMRLHVTGKTLEELFRDALLGMVAVAGPSGSTSKNVVRNVSTEAADPTALLIDFLNQALSWMQIGREAYTAVTFHALTERSLEATLEGYAATGFSEDIKAVTYHEAEVKKNPAGVWETNIVFDI